MLSGLILLPFCNKKELLRLFQKQFPLILLISFFQTSLLYGLLFLGLTMVPGALGAIIIGASPLFAAFTAHFVMPDERLNFKKVLSITLGIMGIIMITLTRQPWHKAGWDEMIGIILLVVACLSSAIGNVIVAKDKKQMHPIPLNAAQHFLGGLLLFIISLPIEGTPDLNQPLNFYLALAWLTILSAIAFSIWFYLLKLKENKVSNLNIWKFIIPVGGAIFSWLLLPEESPELASLAGMIIVAFSIIAYFKIDSLKK